MGGEPGMSGKLCRAVREALDLSQEGLAQRIGVSWVTVSRWENEKASISRGRSFDIVVAARNAGMEKKLDGLGQRLKAEWHSVVEQLALYARPVRGEVSKTVHREGVHAKRGRSA